MKRRSLGLILAFSFTGCTAGKTFIATASDYEAYSKTRVGKTIAIRLAADAKYLKDRPNGVYRDEVKADFAEKETAFYRARASTMSGLEEYLDLIPDGPHSGDAKVALNALRSHKDAPDALAVAAEETRRRLEANARSRALALAEVTHWFDALMNTESFASPLANGPKELVVPFSLGLPAPVCELVEPAKQGVARKCTKSQSADFVIPRKKSYEEREILFDVTLELDARDVPLRAVVAGPDLFERIEETYVEEAAIEDEPTLRAASIQRVIEIVSSAFDGHVSNDPSCTRRDVRAPDALHLECKGLKVVVTSGGAPGADDLIRFEPTR